jgi:uncharacterized protein (DUF427 family)
MGEVIAESEKCELLESNYYFPADSVKKDFLKKTDNQYTCPWKGVCDYYDVTVNGKTEEGAAFMYPEPKVAAENIKGYYAFWKGVVVEK